MPTALQTKWRRAAKIANAYNSVDSYLVENRRPLKFGVGVDGGTMADKAIDVMYNLINKERGDRSYLLHVSDAQKALPVTLQPKYLETDYNTKCQKKNYQPNYTWYLKERQPHEAHPQQLLVGLAESIGLDFLVVGNYGKKDKEVSEAMGSTAEQTLRSADSSIILVKTTGYDLSEEEPRLYILATDNSAASQAAFALLIRKLIRPKKDKLIVIMVSRIVSLSNRLDKYNELIERNGVDGKIEYVTQHGSSVGNAICEYARQKQADFLVMGISGYNQAKIGSVSLDCCYNSRSHVILIKDPREQEADAKKRQDMVTDKGLV